MLVGWRDMDGAGPGHVAAGRVDRRVRAARIHQFAPFAGALCFTKRCVRPERYLVTFSRGSPDTATAENFQQFQLQWTDQGGPIREC